MMDRSYRRWAASLSSRRWFRTALIVFQSSLLASAASAAPTLKLALSLEPIQPDVPFQQVAADEVEDCRIENLDREGWSGWNVLAPDGTVIRRFADTNGDKKIDLWCYFQYGVEVYRDIDSNHNKKADQYRWLGTAGTRWGLDDDEDGTIDRWKAISPEEVSQEVIAALSTRDAQRFARLLATPAELEAIGVGSEKQEELTSQTQAAIRNFKDFVGELEEIGPEAEYVQFAGMTPGVVAEGTDGATRDITVYENAVAMYQDGDQSGQLLLGTVLKLNDAWRLVDLPSVIGAGEAIAQSAGTFFTPNVSSVSASRAPTSMGEDTQELVNQLETIDRKLATAKERETITKLQAARADLVEKLILAHEPGSDDRDTWVRQYIDTLRMAVQAGLYRSGLTRLKSAADRYADDNAQLAAYADFQAIETEYAIRQMPEDADFAKVQEWYLEQLTDFVDQHSGTPEAANAMLQLALSKEFEQEEKEALAYYRKVAKSYPETNAGEKAAGAVRRLESVGSQINLSGTTLGGQKFQLSALRGRPVIVHYWATWCEPCKQDMKTLRRLQAQYQRAKLAVVGVNVDMNREAAIDFTRQARLDWPQLFAEGGLESSPLAKQFGVQTLPTMMLIDRSGKVVEHNIRAAELPDALDSVLR